MSLAGGRRCTSTIVGIVVRLVGRGRTVNSYIKYILYILYTDKGLFWRDDDVSEMFYNT